MSEENKKILLNKARSKQSVNADTILNIDIEGSEKKLPADKVGETIDQYKQYIKEKDGSNKYRLVFTLNPVCSNVLFNRITEIVKDEGSSGCTFYGYNGQIGNFSDYFNGYLKVKGLFLNNKINKKYLSRKRLIRDTGLSHPDLAKDNGLVYHCGYDIFNNHYFRNMEEVLINKLSTSDVTTITDGTGGIRKRPKFTTNTSIIGGVGKPFGGSTSDNSPLFPTGNIPEYISDKSVFNEIGDYARDYDGSNITTLYTNGNTQSLAHLFFKDTTRSFEGSINNGLIERNGWVGFFNPTKIEIGNFDYTYKIGKTEKAAETLTANFTINKCLNNNKACEFIDMYPDRSLYSFIPKTNKYRERNEYNWDYCITYPYKNDFNNELVSFIDENNNIKLNGLKAEFVDKYGNVISDIDYLINDQHVSDYTVEDKEYREFVIKTNVKNNIINGDNIILHLIGETNNGEYITYTVNTTISVRSVGLNGYGTNYYFSINSNDIMSALININGKVISPDVVKNIYCYVQRIDEGRPCKYYFRVFKRLPNFKNSPINNINTISDETINEYCLKDFASSLNKLGFGENIYGDRMAQVVFDDDIDTTNIFDNLGRPISELFLTIVKTNRGNELWYKNTKDGYIGDSQTHFNDESIEFSHCFSDVTSGIDMPWTRQVSKKKLEQYQYNVHGLHNLENNENEVSINKTVTLYPETSEALEKTITISGSTILREGTNSGIGEFLGDICELSENTLSEVVLDYVCHRFNTVQRETTKLWKEFGSLCYDEIVSDDYDGEFNIETYVLGEEIAGKKANDEQNPQYLDNIAPEGYYYKPHYGIQVREYDDTVNEGYDTRVVFDNISIDEEDNTVFYGRTDRNYYFEKGNTIVVYNKKENIFFNGVITSVSDETDDYRTIEFALETPIIADEDEINDVVFFKPNILKPSNAYEFKDGTGKYVWRTLKSAMNISRDSKLYDSVFTNGCHYFHENINFFLKRQDPFGDFWLNSIQNPNVPKGYGILDIIGNEKETATVDYFKEGETNLC